MSEFAWSKEKDAETSEPHSAPLPIALGAQPAAPQNAADGPDIATAKADEIVSDTEDSITIILQPKEEASSAADAPSTDLEFGDVPEADAAEANADVVQAAGEPISFSEARGFESELEDDGAG